MTIKVLGGSLGEAGTAWTAYTPTITTGTFSITTLGAVSGRWKAIGKTVHFSVDIAITVNGTGATDVRATLPVTAVTDNRTVGAGREVNLTANMLQGLVNSAATVVNIYTYNGAYPGGDGRRIILSGTYESA